MTDISNCSSCLVHFKNVYFYISTFIIEKTKTKTKTKIKQNKTKTKQNKNKKTAQMVLYCRARSFKVQTIGIRFSLLQKRKTNKQKQNKTKTENQKNQKQKQIIPIFMSKVFYGKRKRGKCLTKYDLQKIPKTSNTFFSKLM